MIQRLLGGEDDSEGSSGSESGSGSSSDDDEEGSAAADGAAALRRRRHRRRRQRREGHEGVTGADNDTYYFESYAATGIHSEMLRDAVRTDAYRDAIRKNPQWFEGKTVLDIGCGTGILSMFAADAGAAHVVAIDASRIIDETRAIVAANKRGERISCVRAKAEQVEIPPEAPSSRARGGDGLADVLISEWMGYALHYESMLSSVLAVRDRLLRPGGRMLPSRSRILVGAVSDSKYWEERVGFWSRVYGYDMSNMGRHAFQEPHVLVLAPDSIVSAAPHACLSDICMLTMRDADLDIVGAPYELEIVGEGVPMTGPSGIGHEGALAAAATAAAAAAAVGGRTVVLHGLAIWFDIDFGDETKPAAAAVSGGAPAPVRGSGDDDDDDAPPLEDAAEAAPPAAAAAAAAAASTGSPREPYEHVFFSTGAHATPTHWQQTLLLFEQPLTVERGARVRGTLDMTRDAVNPRCYRFAATVEVVGASGADSRRKYTWHMK
jgi:SAM-dependent methyltransferase